MWHTHCFSLLLWPLKFSKNKNENVLNQRKTCELRFRVPSATMWKLLQSWQVHTGKLKCNWKCCIFIYEKNGNRPFHSFSLPMKVKAKPKLRWHTAAWCFMGRWARVESISHKVSISQQALYSVAINYWKENLSPVVSSKSNQRKANECRVLSVNLVRRQIELMANEQMNEPSIF